MPVLSADSLSLVDILLLGVIIVALPLEAFINLKSSRAELASGKPGVRVKHYTQTILWLWVISLPIIVLWATANRSWAELGFRLDANLWALSGWVLALLIAAFFALQFAQVTRSDSVRAQIRDHMSKNSIMTNFMPQTDEERRVFNLMGVSAGIAEEIVFRGYLIWAFTLFMPVWSAATLALLVFTILHAYQGLSQLPGVFAMGALVTLVFLLSGSLWPAIALHIFVDVINNGTVWRARTQMA